MPHHKARKRKREETEAVAELARTSHENQYYFLTLLTSTHSLIRQHLISLVRLLTLFCQWEVHSTNDLSETMDLFKGIAEGEANRWIRDEPQLSGLSSFLRHLVGKFRSLSITGISVNSWDGRLYIPSLPSFNARFAVELYQGRERYLDDEFIWSYFKLVQRCCTWKSIKVIHPQFSSWLMSHTGAELLTWDSEVNLYAHDIIYLACHLGDAGQLGHWVLVSVLPRRRLIHLYDSLSCIENPNTPFYNHIIRLARKLEEWLTAWDRRLGLTEKENWRKRFPRCARQEDGHSCGWFCLWYLKCLIFGRAPNFVNGERAELEEFKTLMFMEYLGELLFPFSRVKGQQDSILFTSFSAWL